MKKEFSVNTSNGQKSVTIRPDRFESYAHLEYKDNGSREQDEQVAPTTLKCGLCFTAVVLASIILSLLSLASSGVTLFELLRGTGDNVEICLPYTDIKGDYTKHLDKVVKNGQFMFCAHTSAQRDFLFQSIIKQKTQEFAAKVVNNVSQILFKGESVCAHVLISGDDNNNRRQSHEEVTLLPKRTLSHGNGIHLGPRRLIITIKGTYYLYSQIYFKVTPSNGTEWINPKTVLSHTVKLHRLSLPNNNGQRNLLYSTNQVFHRNQDHYFQTSFVSGTFNLDSGDEISVTVSKLYHVSRRPEYNYVGLYLLG